MKPSPIQSIALRAAFLSATVVLFAVVLPAQTEKPLYSFKNTADGSNLLVGVVADSAGNLYGSTQLGGANNQGTMFKLTPPTGTGLWTKTDIFDFPPHFLAAVNALAIDAAGNLYATTFYGGTQGSGQVLQVSPPALSGGPWTMTVLHNFTDGGSDGMNPSGLTMSSSGDLFGLTNGGGAHSDGTVFQMHFDGSAWSESVLYTFSGIVVPTGSPVFDARGNLYGVTNFGGTFSCGQFDCGTIFQLKHPSAPGAPWTQSTVYAFTNGPDGGYPVGGLSIDKGGNLFGAVQQNANVFEISPNGSGGWTQKVLYTFGINDGDGAVPRSGPTFAAGNLYGTASEGGIESCMIGCGMVYKLSPPSQAGNPWVETIEHDFEVSGDGHNPYAGLLVGKSGVLYGTTLTGGTGSCSTSETRGCGTVFSIRP